MSENEEFLFESEESEEEIFGGEEELPHEEASGDDKDRKKAGTPRIFLLLLLLLVIVAAAVFFLEPGLLGPEETPPPVPSVKKQVIKLPAAPAEKTPPKEDTGVVQEVLPQESVAAVEKVEPQAETTEAPEEKAEPPVVKAEPAPKEKVETPVPASSAVPAPVVISGRYALQAGAYLFASGLKGAQQRIEQFGYEPRMVKAPKMVAMTRLRVGSYPKDIAQARLEEVRELAPDAFVLREEDQMVVYAGSFYNLDQARALADRLYAQGVRVEEETAHVELPVTMVQFGDFQDKAQADAVAGSARAAGLEVLVVETP